MNRAIKNFAAQRPNPRQCTAEKSSAETTVQNSTTERQNALAPSEAN